MYRTVYDLNEEELNELRETYYYQLFECDEDVLEDCDCASDIPNEVIYNHYDGIYFVDDDFWCNQN